MWQTAGTLIVAFVTLIGGIAAVNKHCPQTVPPGHGGVKFRRGKEVYSHIITLPDGTLLGVVRIYHTGKFIKAIPGLDQTRFIQKMGLTTDDLTISLNVKGKEVWLGRIVLTYDLMDQGIVNALCVWPTNFAQLVSNFFHHVVYTELASQNFDFNPEKLGDVLKDATARHERAPQLGIIPQWVAITECAPAPSTQNRDALREVGDVVREVMLGGPPREFGG